ncbi:MAG: TIGR00266 family protein [Planctomycetes bacterium]|nr:TIGR00266 family protein [Planctomycetota bacterium]
MNIEIQQRGAFGSALVTLEPGESFVSESGAMFRASDNIDFDVTTRSRGKGGLLSGLKRMLGGDSFFLSTYRCRDDSPGEVGLAPTLQGEVRIVPVDRSTPWLCAGGSYLGSSPELELDTQFQGFKGLLSGERLFFMKVTGHGDLLVNAFGRITELEVQDRMIVDTGHVVAFEEGIDYRITKAGKSWLSSMTAGEGFVLEINGRGKVLVQSHNPKEFGTALGKRLPPRKN